MTPPEGDYLSLFKKCTQQYSLQGPMPKRDKLPEKVPYDSNKNVTFVELSKLQKLDNELYKKVAKYDANKDGVLSMDGNNRELDNVYKDLGLDLRKYATKEITSTEIHTETVFTQGEEWSRGAMKYCEKSGRIKVVTKTFNDGSTQETYMTEKSEKPVTNPRMKTEDNAVYNGEKDFRKTIYYKEDGTIIEHYKRGHYSYNEEYGTDDPDGLDKSDNYKEVLVITYSDGKKETIENDAKNIREDCYFHNRIPETTSLKEYVWKTGSYTERY